MSQMAADRLNSSLLGWTTPLGALLAQRILWSNQHIQVNSTDGQPIVRSTRAVDACEAARIRWIVSDSAHVAPRIFGSPFPAGTNATAAISAKSARVSLIAQKETSTHLIDVRLFV